MKIKVELTFSVSEFDIETIEELVEECIASMKGDAEWGGFPLSNVVYHIEEIDD